MIKQYCLWHDKELENVAEHEAEQCARDKMDCDNCGNLKFKEAEVEALDE